MAGYTGAAGTNQGSWNGNGGSLGLTTGNTMYGNTAFGPSGGMASGYATRDMRSLNGAGMGPTMGSYSNFNNLNGSPMFNGALSGQSFRAPNANAAYGQAMAAWQAMNRPQMRPGVNPVSDTPPPVQHVPLPPVQPPIPSVPPPAVSIPPNALMYPFQGQNFNNVWSGYNGPGSTHYQNGSTIYKNGMGDYGGFGNRSTAYKQ